MQFSVKETIDREIIHYASGTTRIGSRSNVIYYEKDGIASSIQLPGDGWKSIFSSYRLGRRALRLDKCNVVPVQDGLVIIRQGKTYHYDNNHKTLSFTLELKNCRNILHQSMLTTESGDLYFGEYGHNPSRNEVPVYRSLDGGRSWQVVYIFPAGTIKHVHGCQWDPYEQKIWVFTGDFNGECYAIRSDPEFDQVEWIGNGQQEYRMCSAFFEPDSIHWIMDSQLEDSFHIRMDRTTRAIEKLSIFPGPVWYTKKLSDGLYLAATAQEIGPGVHDQFAHLLVSKDLENWEDVLQIKHDGYPKRFFKFGVIGFADGIQSSQGFYLFGEALKNLDGRSILCQLT